ncbi:MAG: uracil-DNA glycosylase [Deltaproteobacteria bacterium]|nr:uracil-DNA glycosylase [Deltaproteobacteria bacterium]
MSDTPTATDVWREVDRYLRYCEITECTLIPKPAPAAAPATTATPMVVGTPPPAETPARAPTEDPTARLAAIRAELGDCRRCRLCEGRTKLVFGVGNPFATLAFVGEGPGADEDRQGEPFVGRAGQLLNKIIEAMHLQRTDVWIGNVVKCRPPQNRAPLPDEAATCLPFLRAQLAAIRPQIIVCLGSIATRYVLGDEHLQISKVRGHFMPWNGMTVMPTYHPAFLLRNPAMKKPVWEDMQKVMEALHAQST